MYINIICNTYFKQNQSFHLTIRKIIFEFHGGKENTAKTIFETKTKKVECSKRAMSRVEKIDGNENHAKIDRLHKTNFQFFPTVLPLLLTTVNC